MSFELKAWISVIDSLDVEPTLKAKMKETITNNFRQDSTWSVDKVEKAVGFNKTRAATAYLKGKFNGGPAMTVRKDTPIVPLGTFEIKQDQNGNPVLPRTEESVQLCRNAIKDYKIFWRGNNERRCLKAIMTVMDNGQPGPRIKIIRQCMRAKRLIPGAVGCPAHNENMTGLFYTSADNDRYLYCGDDSNKIKINEDYCKYMDPDVALPQPAHIEDLDRAISEQIDNMVQVVKSHIERNIQKNSNSNAARLEQTTGTLQNFADKLMRAGIQIQQEEVLISD